jgi:hypothetical protein
MNWASEHCHRAIVIPAPHSGDPQSTSRPHDVLWGCLWFLLVPTFKYINIGIWPPLWSSGQSSWVQIQRSGFDSQCYQIFWEVVDLERSPLSFVSTSEELLGRRSSGFCLDNREYDLGIRHADHLAHSILKNWHLLLWQAVVARSV